MRGFEGGTAWFESIRQPPAIILLDHHGVIRWHSQSNQRPEGEATIAGNEDPTPCSSRSSSPATPCSRLTIAAGSEQARPVMSSEHVDMFLLVRRISAYTGADVLLGVFTSPERAQAARAAYLSKKCAADPASDPWHEQAHKADGLVEDDLVIISLPGPAEAVEVFVVSDYDEGFGQICRDFDSIHDSAVTAERRIARLNRTPREHSHYALLQRAELDTPLSDAEADQPAL
ncbi:hypothetical protein [Nannocystis punicea]|uniref:Uncharacterized protein n=1 Tax=Nannocystis punicea TaxID=2995304 RepID=A0ABY7H7I8_9BACT|nr:hypothetical protein [Nannocystis poenicansa]WAS95226.1 hypothetical protein O0S08_03615 [Nannocystis poenicansa]